MADLQAIKILTERKKIHTKFWDLLKSKRKLDASDLEQEISNENKETGEKIEEIEEYIFKIQAEMQALKALRIQLCEEMERLKKKRLLEGKLIVGLYSFHFVLLLNCVYRHARIMMTIECDYYVII